MRDVAFGQYYPSNSFVHKCSPLIKIVFLIVYIVAIFLSKNFYALGACASVFALIAIFAGVPLKSLLRSVRAVLFLLIFMALLNLFLYKGDTVWWEWKFIKITKEAVYYTIFLAARLFLLVLGSSLLTLTTTPVSLADGLEALLSPLKLLFVPVHELALIISIALRFIPILTDETGRIMNAQKARGADFESGGLVKRVKAILPILIPLLISAFRRADELGDAMDARCYSGSKVRTKYKKLTFSWRDLIAFIVGGGLLAGVIVLRIYTTAVL
ncbi:MAG: energy-coupling factor transporter transmembrane protein EcfT [Clostridiales bacterium]|nr:energy-coupling factor transporter transmembrane protein EcfT [Clostridiales bacterium]